jgi:cell division protein FtsW (lipid II flippase)
MPSYRPERVAGAVCIVSVLAALVIGFEFYYADNYKDDRCNQTDDSKISPTTWLWVDGGLWCAVLVFFLVYMCRCYDFSKPMLRGLGWAGALGRLAWVIVGIVVLARTNSECVSASSIGDVFLAMIVISGAGWALVLAEVAWGLVTACCPVDVQASV